MSRAPLTDAQRACAERIRESGVQQVRMAWFDIHGLSRAKTLMPEAAIAALDKGIGMVSTLMLKDTSDRTAYKVFERNDTLARIGFGQANNLVMRPLLDSFTVLPWAPDTGWLQCEPWLADGQPVAIDPRRALQRVLLQLTEQGLSMLCGLEVEFHIYRIVGQHAVPPHAAQWPAEDTEAAPPLALIHPGYQLLSEAWADRAAEPLAIVRDTALGLGLPLESLEIELGPSQVEAVFAPTDALTAADHLMRFRSGVRQALHRAGYHASFICRPPFDAIMSSGWHLHQSLRRRQVLGTRNAFSRATPALGSMPHDATHSLSDLGAQYLAGLLAHAPALTALCTPTVNGYSRFRPHALAPQYRVWGHDNRGAMLRVVGGAGDESTRIENRLGEPCANPYLVMASNVIAGLDGIRCQRTPPPATDDPYGQGHDSVPTTLGAALQALQADDALRLGLGDDLIDHYVRLKTAELDRHAAAEDPREFERREYFSRL